MQVLISHSALVIEAPALEFLKKCSHIKAKAHA